MPAKRSLHSRTAHLPPFAESASRPLIDTKLDGLRSETRNAATSDETGATQRQSRASQKWRLKRVVEYVENHLSEKPALSDLAAVAGLSRTYFASQFRTATGLRPHEFLLRRRIQRAEEIEVRKKAFQHYRHLALADVNLSSNVPFAPQAVVLKSSLGNGRREGAFVPIILCSP